jgi:hypothetical protein
LYGVESVLRTLQLRGYQRNYQHFIAPEDSLPYPVLIIQDLIQISVRLGGFAVAIDFFLLDYDIVGQAVA